MSNIFCCLLLFNTNETKKREGNQADFSLVQCSDQNVEALCEALQATVQQWRGRFPSPLPLELYTSSNFIGLFVEEQVADVLKHFAAEFAAEAARKAGRNRKRGG